MRHVGVLQSGTMHVVHEDGSEQEVGAGQAYVIEPGHDGWVVGDEPVEGFEFESRTAEEYAKGLVVPSRGGAMAGELATEAMVDAEAIQGFAEGVRGRVLRSGDPGYDDARAIWNGDRPPA